MAISGKEMTVGVGDVMSYSLFSQSIMGTTTVEYFLYFLQLVLG
jgi:hypothetical protein